MRLSHSSRLATDGLMMLVYSIGRIVTFLFAWSCFASSPHVLWRAPGLDPFEDFSQSPTLDMADLDRSKQCFLGLKTIEMGF